MRYMHVHIYGKFFMDFKVQIIIEKNLNKYNGIITSLSSYNKDILNYPNLKEKL